MQIFQYHSPFSDFLNRQVFIINLFHQQTVILAFSYQTPSNFNKIETWWLYCSKIIEFGSLIDNFFITLLLCGRAFFG